MNGLILPATRYSGPASRNILPALAGGLIVSWALVITTAAADEPYAVDLTGIYTSQDAANFGEYNDLGSDGAHIALDLDLGNSDDGPGYWRISGRDIGLQTYNAIGEFGQSGRYSFAVEFDGSRQFKRDDGRTPFRGDEFLSLPDGWIAGPITAEMTALDETARPFDQETIRNRVKLDATGYFGERWSLRAAYELEDIERTKVQGASIYLDAAGPNSALLPYSVDYRTQQFSLSGAYTAGRFNASALYTYDDFRNDNDRIAWQNPFAGVISAEVDYPGGIGALSLAPDNEQHLLRTQGRFGVSSKLNISWDGSWARTRQKSDLLPYTANEALQVFVPPPVTELKARVDQVTAGARVTYRPTRRLSLRASYRLDDRDYDKPRDAFRYVRGDGADQPDAALSIFNAAYDYQREGFDVAGDYRLPLSGKLTLKYAFEEVRRGNLAVEETRQDAYTVVLRLSPLQGLTARLEGGYEDRRASPYRFNQSFFLRRSADFINQVPDDQRFDNHPALRQFYLANLETVRGRFGMEYAAFEDWFFSVDYEIRDLDYDRSTLGLTAVRSERISLDAQHTLSEDFTAYAFYTEERYDSDQSGRAFTGGIEKPANRTFPPLPQGSDPSRDWTAGGADQVRTLGLGVTWVLTERLNLEADYVWVSTGTDYDFATGGAPDLDATPLPAIDTRLHDAGFRLRWHGESGWETSFIYRYYRYKADDWALAGVRPDTMDNVLSLGERNYNEAVNLLALSVGRSF